MLVFDICTTPAVVDVEVDGGHQFNIGRWYDIGLFTAANIGLTSV
jgi:hypothetical protein